MNIGKRIKEIRVRNNVTQRELAEKLGLSLNTVSRYETGERRPRIDNVIKIAKALDVEPSELFTGESLKKQKKSLKKCDKTEEYYMIISIEDFEVNKSEIEKVKSILDELAESLVEVAHNPQMTVTISCKLCEPMNEENIT